jgi:glycosyltransferase involved in cell wall biosynthesis
MTISIIIRTKDEESTIGHVLNVLRSQKIASTYEIVIADSGSSDRTLEIARKYDVSICNIPSFAFSYGYSLNYGITHSAGDVVCCLSGHCVPCNNAWLSELVNPILEGKADATYGRQIPTRGINPFEELFLQKHFPEGELRKVRVPFSNANCAFSRAMWNEVKFDEQIPSWEDYLWYQLTKDRFIFRYAQNACVIHSHPFSMHQIARISYRDGKAFRYMKDYYNFNILGNASTMIGKFRYVIKDVSSHTSYLLKEGYLGSFFVLPFVKAYSYIHYWRGYHSNGSDKEASFLRS